MALITSNFFPILYLCIAVVQCDYNRNAQGPWITPHIFVDNGKPVVEFTCSAVLQKHELLTGSQLKAPHQLSRLAMIQQKTDNGFVEIKLRKTLEPSDNGTTLHCFKERMVPNKLPIQSELISGTKTTPLMFQRHIQALETPYVTVEPSSGVKIFDDEEELEFVCRGSAPVDGRGLWWHFKGPDISPTFPPGQSFDKSTNVNRLNLLLKQSYHGCQLYCVQKFKLKVQLPATGEITTMSYGELARSAAITLLYRTLKDTKAAIRVTPGHFVDAHKRFMEFTCYAFSRPGDVLSWYQSKGSKRSEDILLRVMQLRDPVYHGEQWMELTLNKTLEQSDNGSEVYCAKVLPDDFSISIESQRVPLVFQRKIEPLEPAFVTVEPSTSIHFDVNTTLRLTCLGSKPLDGRTYSWFRIDSNSSLSIPEDQKYDASTTMNVLKLSLNETFHQNQLYCAQGFISFIQNMDGSMQIMHYGELVSSKKVTLVQRDKEAKASNTSESPAPPPTQNHAMTVTHGPSENVPQSVYWIYWVVAAAIIILLLIGLIFYIVKARRTAAQLRITQNAIRQSQEEREEVDRMGLRPPLPSPPELIYDSVYDHGAGLLRRPRR